MNVRRVTAARALWTALRGAGGPDAPSVGQRLAALPRMVSATLRGRYPGGSRGRLALMAAAVVYLVSPVDLMPELLLFVAGLADDAVVAVWLAGAVLAETERFLAWESGRRDVVTGEVVTGAPRLR